MRWMIALLAGLMAVPAVESKPRSDEALMIELVNGERTSRGLAPLNWNPVLERLARSHAKDMKRAGRASHISSDDGAGFATRLSRTDLRASTAAENVAYSRDVRTAHEGLMKSEGHRHNILNDALTAIGVGIVEDDEGNIYVVQNFAAPLADMTETEARKGLVRALKEARGNTGRGPMEEWVSLSATLEAELESMIRADSIRVDTDLVSGPAWVIAYTGNDPAELPDEVRVRLRRADTFAVAVFYRRTPSYPFGTWWVILALMGSS